MQKQQQQTAPRGQPCILLVSYSVSDLCHMYVLPLCRCQNLRQPDTTGLPLVVEVPLTENGHRRSLMLHPACCKCRALGRLRGLVSPAASAFKH
eukprot:1934627-Amphidinium_carterae.1